MTREMAQSAATPLIPHHARTDREDRVNISVNIKKQNTNNVNYTYTNNSISIPPDATHPRQQSHARLFLGQEPLHWHPIVVEDEGRVQDLLISLYVNNKNETIYKRDLISTQQQFG